MLLSPCASTAIVGVEKLLVTNDLLELIGFGVGGWMRGLRNTSLAIAAFPHFVFC